jgi:hypothetical protein
MKMRASSFVELATSMSMKARLMHLSLFLTPLLLIGAANLSRAQDGPAPLVTVTTNSPAAAPAPVFVLKPVGIVKEVEKLAQAGADPSVVNAYIQSWPTPYSVTADDVLRLNAAGVPSDILTTLIRHGADLAAQSAASNPPAPPYQDINALPDQGPPSAPDAYAAAPGVDSGAYDYSAPPVYTDYGSPGPYVYPGVVIGGGVIVVYGHHGGGDHGGHQGHGGFEQRPAASGSSAGHSGGSVARPTVPPSHSAGFVAHSTSSSSGAHTSGGSGGHSGSSGGGSSGGHR